MQLRLTKSRVKSIVVTMQVPKRRHSRGRTRRKRNSHYVKSVTNAIKTADGKAYKRPHFDEKVEL